MSDDVGTAQAAPSLEDLVAKAIFKTHDRGDLWESTNSALREHCEVMARAALLVIAARARRHVVYGREEIL